MRQDGEIHVGDIIEFKSDPSSDGIIVNMFDEHGDEHKFVENRQKHNEIKAIVIHQASDSKFATWDTRNLPPFTVTFRGKPN